MDQHCKGHPTHHSIPTQKFVRINAKFPETYVNCNNLFLEYPYKTTPSGKKDAIIRCQKRVVNDHEYSLYKSQWTEIIHTYFKVMVEYMIQGFVYDIPNRYMGRLKLTKRKYLRAYNAKKAKKLNRMACFRNTAFDDYGLRLKWFDKKFKFQSLWSFRFSKSIPLYDKLIKNTSLIHTLDNEAGSY